MPILPLVLIAGGLLFLLRPKDDSDEKTPEEPKAEDSEKEDE